MHVEIILSFALFVGAVLIIFFFLNPLTDKEPTPININLIESIIIKNISENINMMSVITENNNGCYTVPVGYTNIYGSDFTAFQSNENSRKYTIYFSESLDDSNHPGYDASCSTPYNFGVLLEEDLVVYDKIIELNLSYNDDYQALKKSLQIKNDFIIQFKYKDRTQINELTPTPIKTPYGIDIIAEEFPIRAIKSNGEIQELIINIRAWED